MRLAMPGKLGLIILCSCFALLLGLASTGSIASAHTKYDGGPIVQPHVVIKTPNVQPDSDGCALVKVSGHKFYPSLNSMANRAFFYANSTFGASIASRGSVTVDEQGNFYSFPIVVCNLSHVETVFISAVDGATGLQSNYGAFRVY